MAHDDNDSYWNESSVSSKSINFFDIDTEGMLPQSNRTYQGEMDTLEDHTDDSKIIDRSSSHKANMRHDTNQLMTSYIDNNTSLSSSTLSRPHPLTSSSKEQAEVNYLKRKLTEVVLPSTTVLKIVWGYAYSLECYKSREDKLELLDEAINTGDGNAILVVVLFLERTMRSSLFNLEMSRRPLAVDHYVHHLLMEESYNKLLDALGLFHKSDNAAMLKFKLATNASDASSKVNNLKKCLASHFLVDATLSHEAYIVQRYIDLLELQVPIQENDEKEKVQGSNRILQDIPPAVPLVGTSALSTLYYCCLYHYDKSENFLVSPSTVKKSQRLSDKQYLWKAMSALIRLKKWTEFDALFATKTWMGGVKMRSPINFDRIVSLLHHMSAPKELKEKYCMLVDDTDQRIQIASKCACHEVVLKTYKDLRNRHQIEEYITFLKNNTPEYFLATELLNDTSIKWKN